MVLQVISIEEIPQEDEYVYDLETEDGTFFAGSNTEGLILCKNTDSCYVKFNIYKEDFNSEEEYLKEYSRISEECTKRLSNLFKSPIKLEFEKIMYPFYIYAKKMYAFKKWTTKQGFEGIEYKGLAIVKKNFCEFTRETLNQTIILMMNEGTPAARKYIREKILDLINGKIPIEKLIISKSLKNEYKYKGKVIPWRKGLCEIHNCIKVKNSICTSCISCNNSNSGLNFFINSPKKFQECKECKNKFLDLPYPHVSIAQKKLLQDPINGPRPPDRINFVYIKTSKKFTKQKDIVKAPDELSSTDKIDYKYYFEHQLKTSIDQFFSITEYKNNVYSALFNSNISDLFKKI